MAYDKDKFEALVSLEVPYKIALALADDDSPLNVEAVEVPVLPATADLESESELVDVIDYINDLLAALRTAGLMEEPEE